MHNLKVHKDVLKLRIALARAISSNRKNKLKVAAIFEELAAVSDDKQDERLNDKVIVYKGSFIFDV